MRVTDQSTRTAITATSDDVRSIAERVGSGHTLLIVGNGPNAALGQRVAARLSAAGIVARPLTVDATTITAIANDYGFEQVYARQVQALARPGDALLVLSTGVPHASLVEAAAAAKHALVDVISAATDESTDQTTVGDQRLGLDDLLDLLGSAAARDRS